MKNIWQTSLPVAMRKGIVGLLIGLISFQVYAQAVPTPAPSWQVPIKDLVHVEGLRDNQLTGLGLVTGLNGQGDSASNPMLKYALASLVNNLGLAIPRNDVKSRNTAVVAVTCLLGPYVNPGDTLNIHVASLGDAKNLQGGVLIQTPLLAANGQVYAVAQGTLPSVLSGNSSSGATVLTIPGGAIAEKAVNATFVSGGKITLLVNDQDFTTAEAVATGIRKALPEVGVEVPDPGHIQLTLPAKTSPVALLSQINAILVTPSLSNEVVINQSTGIVVSGQNVRIASVAVSIKGAKVSIGKQNQNSDWGGTNTSEQFSLPNVATVQDLVSTLQQLGLTTDQLIAVLKAINQAGALYGRLVVTSG